MRENLKQSRLLSAQKTVFLHELNKRNPNKHFYLLKKMQQCADMKKVTLEKVRDCLKYESGQITVPSDVCRLAVKPLEKMLEMAK